MFRWLQGKGEVFTYFLVGEDCVQRLRRMSVEKPELFLSVTCSECSVPSPAPLTPVISRGEDNESLCSSVILLEDEVNFLPTVCVSEPTAVTTAAIAGLAAAAIGTGGTNAVVPAMNTAIGCTASVSSVGVNPLISGLVDKQTNRIQLECA